VRLRPVLAPYGLRGAWSTVTLTDANSWPSAREELIGLYYQRFGLIHLRDGSKTIRWNEFTWRGIREALEFERDPQFDAQAPAGPPQG
jgi:hypothetical protein